MGLIALIDHTFERHNPLYILDCSRGYSFNEDWLSPIEDGPPKARSLGHTVVKNGKILN